METQNVQIEGITEFIPGSTVMYGTHGKFKIANVETKKLEERSILFYKLEAIKNPNSKILKNETAIWVPVKSAKQQGLRAPMSLIEANEAMQILQNREYYFKTHENWNSLLPILEQTIRTQGGVGLAKVASYLYVLKRKQIVLKPEINKFQEMIWKLLFKELSEALNEPAKNLEDKVQKGLRSKLTLDN